MKKLFLSAILIAGFSACIRAAATITSYVQTNPSGQQPGTFNISSGTVGQMTVSGLAANQCVQTGTGGLLSTSGALCGAGGGGGASTLATAIGGASGFSLKISSPTGAVIMDSNTFNGTFVAGATAYYSLNSSSVTLKGQNVLISTSSLTPGTTLYIASGTVNGQFTASTYTFTDGSFAALEVGTGFGPGNQSYFYGGSGNKTLTGFSNLGVGQFSLQNLTTGSSNVCFGDTTCGSITSGSSNTAIGLATLQQLTTGNNNTVFGNFALPTNDITGSSNTVVGSNAGTQEQGSGDTYIGFNTGPLALKTLTNSSAIGANAVVSSSNTMQLGASGIVVNMSSMTASTVNISSNTILPGATFYQGSASIITNANIGILNVTNSVVLSSLTVGGISDTAHFNVRGSAPTLSSCGGTPAVAGTDNAGQVTEGTGSPAGCVVSFANAFTNTPFCVAQTTSTAITSVISAISNSQFTITLTGAAPALTVTYLCTGRD